MIKQSWMVIRVSKGFALHRLFHAMSLPVVQLKTYGSGHLAVDRYVLGTEYPETLRGFIRDMNVRYPGVYLAEETEEHLPQMKTDDFQYNTGLEGGRWDVAHLGK